jgi:transposase
MTTQFLQCLLPGFQLLRLEYEEIDTDGHHKLQSIGLALGGAAGAHLCHQIGIVACGSTLLNHLNKLSLPAVKVPKILGVDDFAFRKGQRYGTILVDLELNQPIALLADRKAETLTDWLIEHPGVEILSRDRSKTYKSAMDKGAPAAIQVADRFHLVQNLEETLAQVFSRYGNELKAVEQQQRQNSASVL